MNFKQWIEAVLDPSILKLHKVKYGDHAHVGRTFSLKIDNNGKVAKMTSSDWEKSLPHFEINPSAQDIRLQSISPQSVDFRKLVTALKTKYPDIYEWDVETFIAAGHMQTGNKKWNRTVGYWMKQEPVNFKNKLPKFLYHGTSTNLWYEGIKKNGLLPRKLSGSMGSYGAQNVESLSKSNFVYLSLHPDVATRSAATQAAEKHGGRPLILKIDSKGLFPDKFHKDEDASQANSAADSARLISTVAYEGRIPASIITPFMIGKRYEEKNRYYDRWEKFKDTPIVEHPLTSQLKQGHAPYYNDSAYYALLDAGIIHHVDKYDSRGFRTSATEVAKDVNDTEIRKILKNAGWTHNVRAILDDLEKGYDGSLYYLKDASIPSNITPKQQKMIDLLIESGMLHIEKSGEHRYYYLNNWNATDKAIKLAKSMGKMDFSEMAKEIKDIIKNSPRD